MVIFNMNPGYTHEGWNQINDTGTGEGDWDVILSTGVSIRNPAGNPVPQINMGVARTSWN